MYAVIDIETGGFSREKNGLCEVSVIFLDKDNDGMGADVESRADYSVYLEFGTKDMQPRPFMQPALESQRAKIKALFKRLKARG